MKMNRREFGKMVAAVFVAPASLAVLPKKKGLMVADLIKICDEMKRRELDYCFPYRGFTVTWHEHHGIRRCYVSDGKVAVAYDSLGQSFYEFWTQTKPAIDKAIDRHERRVA